MRFLFTFKSVRPMIKDVSAVIFTLFKVSQTLLSHVSFSKMWCEIWLLFLGGLATCWFDGVFAYTSGYRARVICITRDNFYCVKFMQRHSDNDLFIPFSDNELKTTFCSMSFSKTGECNLGDLVISCLPIDNITPNTHHFFLIHVIHIVKKIKRIPFRAKQQSYNVLRRKVL